MDKYDDNDDKKKIRKRNDKNAPEKTKHHVRHFPNLKRQARTRLRIRIEIYRIRIRSSRKSDLDVIKNKKSKKKIIFNTDSSFNKRISTLWSKVFMPDK